MIKMIKMIKNKIFLSILILSNSIFSMNINESDKIVEIMTTFNDKVLLKIAENFFSAVMQKELHRYIAQLNDTPKKTSLLSILNSIVSSPIFQASIMTIICGYISIFYFKLYEKKREDTELNCFMEFVKINRKDNIGYIPDQIEQFSAKFKHTLEINWLKKTSSNPIIKSSENKKLKSDEQQKIYSEEEINNIIKKIQSKIKENDIEIKECDIKREADIEENIEEDLYSDSILKYYIKKKIGYDQNKFEEDCEQIYNQYYNCLMYGPTGTGKTYSIEQILKIGCPNEIEEIFFQDIPPGLLQGVYVNTFSTKIEVLKKSIINFKQNLKKQYNKKKIIIALSFNEVDGLVRDRSRHASIYDSAENEKATSAFLGFFDTINAMNNADSEVKVIIFSTTNLLTMIDKAFWRKGRMRFTLEINNPSRENKIKFMDYVKINKTDPLFNYIITKKEKDCMRVTTYAGIQDKIADYRYYFQNEINKVIDEEMKDDLK